jgi:hypothetical protein
MRHGFRASVALSEFATAAALITIAACAVSYFYTKSHTGESCPAKEPTITIDQTYFIPVPAPHVHIKVVVPKPEPQPKTDIQLEPESEKQPKVWDNDNIPHADDPPVFTTSLRKP